MTINKRKHTPSARQSRGDRVRFQQNTKSILSATGRFSAGLAVLIALCSLSSAQSQDSANPTLITTKTVEGKASGAGATYYYRFAAHKGSVQVTLVGQTDNYSTQFEADLTNSGGAD